MEQEEKPLTLEEKITEFRRKGDMEKVNFVEKLHKRLLPSQIEKIQAGDKRVLRELFLPKWISWETLQEWAEQFKHEKKGLFCVFCGQQSELGINFLEKFVCENCFFKLKKL